MRAAKGRNFGGIPPSLNNAVLEPLAKRMSVIYCEVLRSWAPYFEASNYITIVLNAGTVFSIGELAFLSLIHQKLPILVTKRLPCSIEPHLI
jgi:hypothetical protein